jgi:hypothetical protein
MKELCYPTLNLPLNSYYVIQIFCLSQNQENKQVTFKYDHTQDRVKKYDTYLRSHQLRSGPHPIPEAPVEQESCIPSHPKRKETPFLKSQSSLQLLDSQRDK